MDREQKLYRIWAILFLGGLLAGAFLTNIFFQNQAGIEQLWSLDHYDAITAGELEQKQYFIFLLLRRGKQLLCILLLFFFTNRMLGIGIPLFLFSFSASALLSLETMRLGIAGLFLSLSYLVPQYVCYGIGVYNLSRLGSGNKTSYQMIVGLFLTVFLFIMGCYLEAFWNPFFVQAAASIISQIK